MVSITGAPVILWRTMLLIQTSIRSDLGVARTWTLLGSIPDSGTITLYSNAPSAISIGGGACWQTKGSLRIITEAFDRIDTGAHQRAVCLFGTVPSNDSVEWGCTVRFIAIVVCKMRATLKQGMRTSTSSVISVISVSESCPSNAHQGDSLPWSPEPFRLRARFHPAAMF